MSIADGKLASGPTSAKSCQANRSLKADAQRDIDNVNEFSATNVKGTTVQISNEWRFRVQGGNLEFQYSSDNGSTWSTKETFNNA